MKLGDATISIFISELGQYRVTVNYATLTGGTVQWHTFSRKADISIEVDDAQHALRELLENVLNDLPE